MRAKQQTPQIAERGNCKSVTRPVCRQFTSRSPQRLSPPEPIFDQIQISLFSYDNPYPIFVEKFGTPIKKILQNGRFFWQFKNGLFLSQKSSHDYFLIIFQAEEKLLRQLNSFLHHFSPHPKYGQAAKLKSAEIAFDIPCGTSSYNVAERMLKRLVALADPKNYHARLKRVSGVDREMTRDGAENGNCTNYFTKLVAKKDGGEKPIRSPSWSAKIYPKAFDGRWNIRCEITLQKESLQRYLSKSIPQHVEVNRNGNHVKLSNFFRFAQFDWQEFTNAVNAIVAKKQFQRIDELEVLLDKGRCGTISEKKHHARIISRFIKSAWLERRIGKREFEHEKQVFDKPEE